MSAHTPGPWGVLGGDAPVRAGDGSVLVGPKAGKLSDAVASVWGDDNARLIAAAPDLLELLKRHLSWFDGEFHSGAEEAAFIAATRAALAKALGE